MPVTDQVEADEDRRLQPARSEGLSTPGRLEPAVRTDRFTAPAPAPDAAPRGPWRFGVASGVVLALVLQPFVTVLPYGFSHAIVHALVTAAVAALCFSLARRLDLSDPPFAVGLAAGCLAFAIHGFVDYDLYVPGVMATFAVTLGLLLADARPRPARPLARALTLAWGILSLVAPSAIALLAATREHAH
jgi:hypothetical protein